MPNFCDNVLWAYGPQSEIDRFLEKAQGCGVAWGDDPAVAVGDSKRRTRPLDFNQFVPVPAEVAAAGYRDKSGPENQEAVPGGRSWCEENWGTKWNAGPDTNAVRVSDCEVRFSFDTAWSPPQAVVMAMSKQFPHLMFKLVFSEISAAFTGTLICHHGVRVLIECQDYELVECSWDKDDGRPGGTPSVCASIEDL